MTLTRKEIAERVRAEGPIPLSEACELFPAPTAAGHPGPATLLRFIVSGKRGVRLDGARVRGQWHTSAAAVGRFLNALADRVQAEREAVWG